MVLPHHPAGQGDICLAERMDRAFAGGDSCRRGHHLPVEADPFRGESSLLRGIPSLRRIDKFGL